MFFRREVLLPAKAAIVVLQSCALPLEIEYWSLGSFSLSAISRLYNNQGKPFALVSIVAIVARELASQTPRRAQCFFDRYLSELLTGMRRSVFAARFTEQSRSKPAHPINRPFARLSTL